MIGPPLGLISRGRRQGLHRPLQPLGQSLRPVLVVDAEECSLDDGHHGAVAFLAEEQVALLPHSPYLVVVRLLHPLFYSIDILGKSYAQDLRQIRGVHSHCPEANVSMQGFHASQSLAGAAASPVLLDAVAVDAPQSQDVPVPAELALVEQVHLRGLARVLGELCPQAASLDPTLAGALEPVQGFIVTGPQLHTQAPGQLLAGGSSFRGRVLLGVDPVVLMLQQVLACALAQTSIVVDLDAADLAEPVGLAFLYVDALAIRIHPHLQAALPIPRGS